MLHAERIVGTGCGSAILFLAIISISAKPPPSWGIAKPPFPAHPPHSNMAQGTQQTTEDRPKFTTRFTIWAAAGFVDTRLR